MPDRQDMVPDGIHDGRCPLFHAVLDAVCNAAKKSIDIALNSDYGNDLFICMACGGPDDIACKGAVQTAQKLLGDERIHFGTDFQKDNFFFLASDNPHKDPYIRFYLYNAFRSGLFRDGGFGAD